MQQCHVCAYVLIKACRNFRVCTVKHAILTYSSFIPSLNKQSKIRASISDMSTALPSMDTTEDNNDVMDQGYITMFNKAVHDSYSSISETVLLLPQKLLSMVRDHGGCIVQTPACSRL